MRLIHIDYHINSIQNLLAFQLNTQRLLRFLPVNASAIKLIKFIDVTTKRKAQKTKLTDQNKLTKFQ
jgi:hypothetical protein